MAELTTTAGETIVFDPAAVAAVAEEDADTGDRVTTVYGVGAFALRIAESPIAFMARTEASGRFAQLTRPDGTAVWIAGPAVTSLRAAPPGEFAPGVNTVITTGPLTQGVQETPAQARTLLDTAHAAL